MNDIFFHDVWLPFFSASEASAHAVVASFTALSRSIHNKNEFWAMTRP
jgi:hypothetical protein